MVATSTFGSKITAMKNAIELIEALCYKLRMFGIPIDGPANVFCNNKAVVKNCSTPESTLKKKHHSIAYYRNREAVASGLIRIAKEALLRSQSIAEEVGLSGLTEQEIDAEIKYLRDAEASD